MKWMNIDRDLRNAISRLATYADRFVAALDDYQYVVAAAKGRWPGEPEKAEEEERFYRKELEKRYKLFAIDFEKLQEELPELKN